MNAKTTPQAIHICDVESNEQVHVDKFKNILSEMREAKAQKKISYVLGYSNFTFELWMVLHKREDAFVRCLKKLTLENVRAAVQRAETITSLNEKAGKALAQYKGYSYYRDNPALSIHIVVKTILDECGVL